jgi:hypothetical protein
MLLLMCRAAMANDGDLFKPLSPESAELNQYKWQKRPLVIFAPSKNDADYLQQMAMLEGNKAQLAERDIVVLSDTSPKDHGKLRAQFKPTSFEVVLVGKDGGMKLRDQKPISADVLFSTIDQMPMRRANAD